jgi:hypothetical protein
LESNHAWDFFDKHHIVLGKQSKISENRCLAAIQFSVDMHTELYFLIMNLRRKSCIRWKHLSVLVLVQAVCTEAFCNLEVEKSADDDEEEEEQTSLGLSNLDSPALQVVPNDYVHVHQVQCPSTPVCATYGFEKAYHLQWEMSIMQELE